VHARSWSGCSIHMIFVVRSDDNRKRSFATSGGHKDDVVVIRDGDNGHGSFRRDGYLGEGGRTLCVHYVYVCGGWGTSDVDVSPGRVPYTATDQ
jgi:hypothetical protein